VDIEQPGFTRLHERRVTDAGGADRFERLARLMTAYQAALPEAQRAVLARNLLPPFELTRLDTTMNAGAVVATHRGRSIRATLSLLWSVPSMNRYDQTPLGRSCVDQDRALCSACKPAVRWVNGDALPSWQCSAKGIRLDPQEGEAAAACFCAARGHMYGLTVSASGAAQGATGANANRVVTTLSRPGSKVLVEPHQTLQMLSEQPVAGHWDDDTMLSYDGSNSSVEFLVTPEGFALVVGTAVHQGSSNSTRYPVFGAIGP
jgi:hypothetical protein